MFTGFHFPIGITTCLVMRICYHPSITYFHVRVLLNQPMLLLTKNCKWGLEDVNNEDENEAAQIWQDRKQKNSQGQVWKFDLFPHGDLVATSAKIWRSPGYSPASHIRLSRTRNVINLTVCVFITLLRQCSYIRFVL